MKLSKEQFMQMQEERQTQRQNYSQQQDRVYVSYFGLKDDGDEAIVRFACDPEDFEVFTVHPVTIDGKFRKVNCINDITTGIHSCPLCESGTQLQNRFYIKLLEYVRDENGNIVAQPRVWERPTSYIQRLVNLFTEYGSLKDNIFKIKRNGARGDMKTDYVFMFGNPSIYNEQLYPKDFSAFENYSPLGTAILNKNADEMRELVHGHTGETFTPQSQVQKPVVPPTSAGAPDYSSTGMFTPQIDFNQSQQNEQPVRRSPVMY